MSVGSILQEIIPNERKLEQTLKNMALKEGPKGGPEIADPRAV